MILSIFFLSSITLVSEEKLILLHLRLICDLYPIPSIFILIVISAYSFFLLFSVLPFNNRIVGPSWNISYFQRKPPSVNLKSWILTFYSYFIGPCCSITETKADPISWFLFDPVYQSVCLLPISCIL